MTATKRDRLLDCAAELFRENGFKATGIDRILQESGCAKMTLYNHFRSKEELILECVRRADERWRTTFIREIERSSSEPRERLLAPFDIAARIVDDERFCGCFFVRAASEFREREDPVHAAAADNKRLFMAYLAEQASAAGARDPARVAMSLMMLLDGALTYAHVCGDPAAVALARENADRLLADHFD